LYRESMSVGGGNLSADVFFAVASESNFFIK
jgi:hypothetical protein